MTSRTTRLETLLEAVPDALVGMDQKGMIRFVNHETESLFGYDRDDLIGEPVETLLPGPLWQIYASHDEYFADPRTRSSGLDLELSGRQRDGTDLPVNISMSHIDTGDVLLVITAVRDVTQRRSAIKNAELVAAIVQYSDDAIIGATLDGVITSWNPAAERMYGYSSNEIIGKSASLLDPAGRVGVLFASLAKIRADKRVEAFETVSVRRDGSTVHVSATVAPIRDEDGFVAGVSVIHRDVTEQRRAFEVSRRMEAIVQNCGDAIIGETLEGIITSWNPAAERMYGYSGEEIIGKSLSVLIPEDRGQELEAILSSIRAGQLVEGLETIRVRKDGSVFPVSGTVSPIRDEHGAVTGASAIHRDVTEARKALEVAQRMASIVENSEDAIIGSTLDRIITSWNPAAERMFGYSSEETIGKSSRLFTPEDRVDEIGTILAEIRAGRHVENFETICLRKDGTAFPVSFTVSPIRDPDGEVVGISTIIRDVAAQRRAFEVARRMEAIVQNCGDAIIGKTLEGIITSWNPAAEKMYGYSGEEIIGKSISVLIPEDRRQELEAILSSIRAGQLVEGLETICVRKDGSVVPVSGTVSPIRDENGAVTGASAIHRDVTEQRKALEVAQRMASIVENSDDAIIGSTLDRIITSWNPAAERMFGYSSEETIGKPPKPPKPFTPEDRADEIGTILAEIRAGRHVENFETIRLRKDGTVFPVSLTVSPIRDPDGEVVGISTIIRDVAEQRRAFEVARRMEAIVQNCGDAIVSETLEGIITSWNPAAEKMYGYSGEEIIGKSISLLIPEDRSQELEAILSSIRAGQPVEGLETIRVRKDGSVVPVSGTVSPIRDENGAVTGASAIYRDVTEPRKALVTAQRLATIVESSDDGIVSSTLDGIITSWNPAAERMFGYSSDKIVQRSIDLLSPADRSGEITGVLAKIRAGRPVEDACDFETICVRKDRTTFPVRLAIAPIRDVDYSIIGASTIVRDVTEQRQSVEAAEHMAAIVEYSADAIFSQTLEGKVTSWNPAAERAYGYSRQEIIGKPIELLSPEGRTGEITSILARIKGGQAVEHHETVRVRKDGTAIRVSLTVSPICVASGAIVGASVIQRDLADPGST